MVPVLLREEALDIAMARRKRRLLFLEPEERVVSEKRVYRPLHRVEIRYIGGFIKKSTKTASFVIDGHTGCIVEIDPWAEGQAGVLRLLGLDEAAVRDRHRASKRRLDAGRDRGGDPSPARCGEEGGKEP